MNKRCQLRKCLTPKDPGSPSTTPDSYFERHTRWKKKMVKCVSCQRCENCRWVFLCFYRTFTNDKFTLGSKTVGNVDKKKFGGPGKLNKRCKLRKCLTPKIESRETGSNLTLNGEEIKAELLDNPGTFVVVNSENSQGTLTSQLKESFNVRKVSVSRLTSPLKQKCQNCR